MLLIFESILPIFLLVLLGAALKRSSFINATLWDGLEQLGYYVLFPALLFYTLATADFTKIDIGLIGAVSNGAVILMAGLVLALWPVLRRAGVGAPAFSSLFQCSTRWNAFVALAIGQKVFGTEGIAIIAVIMAAIIVPINLINVSVLLWFSGRWQGYRIFALRIVTNPLIFSSVAGIVVNLLHIPIYQPLMVTVGLVSQASLSLGLIAVGAGLRIADALKPGAMVMLGTALKLLMFPAVMVGLAILCHVGGETLVLLALSASVPTAMNGYLLAKKMGGDADLYAATATVQTVASFFTIPLVMIAASQLAAG
ncbi:AEC family transporter [Neorhizobium huautlense]|uniref:AEC family transporter n=1 Tax=Neorhizobium huautlense TaxID=67774 RepID=UPI000CF96A82|nr:AEC family transporter [Neorhizobium huautlense]